MDLKYCKVDPDNVTKEELEKKIQRLEHQMWDKYNIQLAIKILLNSAYGVIGNQYFICYEKNIAEAITMQGQDIITFSAKTITNYFKKVWPYDTEIHEKMGIEITNEITQPVVVYGDTDSVAGDSVIKTSIGEDTIENIFNQLSIEKGMIIENGKTTQQEVVKNPNFDILNYKNDKIVYSPVKYIYRHKVNKPKWLLKCKSGKQIEVTGDHSLIVFRNGEKLAIKAKDIQKNDKILKIK